MDTINLKVLACRQAHPVHHLKDKDYTCQWCGTTNTELASLGETYKYLDMGLLVEGKSRGRGY